HRLRGGRTPQHAALLPERLYLRTSGHHRRRYRAARHRLCADHFRLCRLFATIRAHRQSSALAIARAPRSPPSSAALPLWPMPPHCEVAVGQRRLGVRHFRLAARLGGLLLLRREFCPLRRDLRLAWRGDRASLLALSLLLHRAPRRRAQRRARAADGARHHERRAEAERETGCLCRRSCGGRCAGREAARKRGYGRSRGGQAWRRLSIRGFCQVLAFSNRRRTSPAKITNSAPKVAATIQTVCAEAGSRLPVINGSLAMISPAIH